MVSHIVSFYAHTGYYWVHGASKKFGLYVQVFIGGLSENAHLTPRLGDEQPQKEDLLGLVVLRVDVEEALQHASSMNGGEVEP